MKKLSAIILSMITCSLLAVPLLGNALAIMVDETKYEEWYELEEYTEYPYGNIYKATDIYSADYFLICSEKYSETDEVFSYVPFSIDFSHYALTQEDYFILSEYLSQNYPYIEISSENETYENGRKYRHVLDYNSDFTIDEKFEIAVDIKENTGLICNYSWLSSSIEVTVIEETTTTTTTTASETTTTTTTTAAASSTTAKKGVDSPKTGDAGLAGALLAGAGAVAMAFALRKRED